jgi:sugar phosphate permease
MSETVETPSPYRWVILGVLWVAYIVVYLNRMSVGPLGPFLKHDLGITSAQIGMVMSAAMFGYVFTQLPSGWVVDRIGARWPIAVGEVIAGLSMITLFFVPSYSRLLIFMFVTGLGCGFLMPATSQGVMVWFPQRERATVMGLKQTAVNIGGMISAVTLPIVAVSLGWRYGFLLVGLAALGLGLYSRPLRSDFSEPGNLVGSHGRGMSLLGGSCSIDPSGPLPHRGRPYFSGGGRRALGRVSGHRCAG